MFSGLPRVRHNAFKFWLDFVYRYNPQIFVHTWDDDLDSIKMILGNFKPVRLRIDKPESFDITPYESHQRDDINISNILSMWTSVYRCFDLLDKHYHDLPKPATIIRARFDVWVPDGFELIPSTSLAIPMEPLKEPGCEHYKEQYMVSQQEIISYGNYEQMKVYCNCIHHIPAIMNSQENFPFISEYICAANLMDHRVGFWNYPLKFELDR